MFPILKYGISGVVAQLKFFDHAQATQTPGHESCRASGLLEIPFAPLDAWEEKSFEAEPRFRGRRAGSRRSGPNSQNEGI